MPKDSDNKSAEQIYRENTRPLGQEQEVSGPLVYDQVIPNGQGTAQPDPAHYG